MQMQQQNDLHIQAYKEEKFGSFLICSFEISGLPEGPGIEFQTLSQNLSKHSLYVSPRFHNDMATGDTVVRSSKDQFSEAGETLPLPDQSFSPPPPLDLDKSSRLYAHHAVGFVQTWL